MAIRPKQWLVIFLCLALCALPFFTEQPLNQRFLYFIFFLIVYCVSLFFWLSFFPFQPETQRGGIRFFYLYLSDLIHRGNVVGLVQNGMFDKDYFAIQNKPPISSLIIDQNSAVIAKNRHNKRIFLPNGLWQLEDGATITHVFDLRPHAYIYGPETNRNPFFAYTQNRTMERGINPVYLDIERTRSQTADGLELAAGFFISYKLIAPNQSGRSVRDLLAFSAFLEAKHQFGNMSEWIEEMIGSYVASQFKDTVKTISLKDAQQDSTNSDGLLSFFQYLIDAPGFLNIPPAINHLHAKNAWLGLFKLKIELLRIWTR